MVEKLSLAIVMTNDYQSSQAVMGSSCTQNLLGHFVC